MVWTVAPRRLEVIPSGPRWVGSLCEANSLSRLYQCSVLYPLAETRNKVLQENCENGQQLTLVFATIANTNRCDIYIIEFTSKRAFACISQVALRSGFGFLKQPNVPRLASRNPFNTMRMSPSSFCNC